MQQKKTLFHEGEIISLDDFGISGLANRRILELARTGKIGRVSVMADRSIEKEEAETLSLSGVKLDIHLDMDGPNDGTGKIEGGFFRRISIFLVGYLSGKYRAKAVMEKWESQIENFRKIFGRDPDGLNSHQHVHFFPPLFRVALRLAEKYGIGYVRLGKHGSGSCRPIAIVLDLLRIFNRKKMERSRIGSSDLMLSADWISGFNLEQYCKRFPSDNKIEIIFHPERDEEFFFLKKYLD